MKKKLILFLIAVLPVLGNDILANNLQIANVSLNSINTADDFIMVKFDISWENSWRTSSTPNNWDAAWIFVKYRMNGGEWQHAALSNVALDHIAPSGSTIAPSPDGAGVFIYRSADGSGTNNWTNAQLRWKYTQNGVSDNSTNVEIRVIGIEMVYVPAGAFYAGDNATSVASFKQGSADNDPWYIGSESLISVVDATGTGTGVGPNNAEYYYVTDNQVYDDITGATFNIPAAFPKGYNAFYCMKYEITQGQYTEFLNMLNRTQQISRVASNISGDAVANIYAMSNQNFIQFRSAIVCPTSGNGTTAPVIFSTATPEITCNFLSWADGTAYSDWAGLRPMTELEFEKACRGPLTSVSGEFAWGGTTIAATAYTYVNNGFYNERINTNYSTTTGNASYLTTTGNTTSIPGPLRVGIFADNTGNTGRMTSGSGYYGIMELSGNVWERIITVGNSTGRNFTGNNGNGILNASGNADVANWPDASALGSGFKGGVWDYSSDYSRISDRTSAAYQLSIRQEYLGFRGVRGQ